MVGNWQQHCVGEATLNMADGESIYNCVLLQVLGEIEEIVCTGCWVGDCFIYTNSVNRLNYFVGGQIVTIAHLDR